MLICNLLNPSSRKLIVKRAATVWFAIMALSCSALAIAAQEGHYFFVYVSGTWTENNVGYISNPIYYPGYSECGKQRDIDVYAKAKDRFATYLEAHHGEQYLRNNITQEQWKMNSNDYMKSSQDTNDRLMTMAADERRDGRRLVQTNFSYSCN